VATNRLSVFLLFFYGWYRALSLVLRLRIATLQSRSVPCNVCHLRRGPLCEFLRVDFDVLLRGIRCPSVGPFRAFRGLLASPLHVPERCQTALSPQIASAVARSFLFLRAEVFTTFARLSNESARIVEGKHELNQRNLVAWNEQHGRFCS